MNQIIQKPIPQYDFELYATDKTFSMLINFSTIVKIFAKANTYIYF